MSKSNKKSFETVDRLAKTHTSHETLTPEDKEIILETYQPIGQTDEWVDWVLSSSKRGLCPYR